MAFIHQDSLLESIFKYIILLILFFLIAFSGIFAKWEEEAKKAKIDKENRNNILWTDR